MASLEKYIIDVESLRIKIEYLKECAQINSENDFIAARKIQAWFRGIITRNYMRQLNYFALIIQRNWRSYQSRIFVKEYAKQRALELRELHYNNSAVKIQATWRGYWMRKNNVNMKQIKQWCQEVKNKNEEVLQYMKKYREYKEAEIEDAREEDSFRWVLFILFKLHYLLRTERLPGVLTRIDKSQFTLIEDMIRNCFEYTFCGSRKLQK